MFYTYVLLSKKDDRWYTGSTGDSKNALTNTIPEKIFPLSIESLSN